MKKNLSNDLLDIDGQTIKDEKGHNLTVGRTCINALLNHLENNVPANEKLARYDLALTIKMNEKECELTAEQLSLIKKCVGEIYKPVVVGFVHRYLESSSSDVK